MAELPRDRCLPGEVTRRTVKFGSLGRETSLQNGEDSRSSELTVDERQVLNQLISASETRSPRLRLRSYSCPDLSTKLSKEVETMTSSTQTDVRGGEHNRYQLLQNAAKPQPLRPDKENGRRMRRQNKEKDSAAKIVNKHSRDEQRQRAERQKSVRFAEEEESLHEEDHSALVKARTFKQRQSQQADKLDNMIANLPLELAAFFELPELPEVIIVQDWDSVDPSYAREQVCEYEPRGQSFHTLMEEVRNAASLACTLQNDRLTMIPVWLKQLEAAWNTPHH